MKLEFSHSGRQFFFVTLALEGRPKVLSRLGEMGDEPVLSREGEIVVDYLKAVHSVWSSVTISNRVIMPDHIHFLMIVNYDRARDFNPLWASFMLMEAIEEAWGRTGRTDGGLPPPEPPEEVVERFLLVVSRGRLVAREIISLMKERGLSREEALVELSREGRFTAGRDFGALSREGEFVGGRDFGVLSREGELIGGLGGVSPPSVQLFVLSDASTLSSRLTRASLKQSGGISSLTRRGQFGRRLTLIVLFDLLIYGMRFLIQTACGMRWVM